MLKRLFLVALCLALLAGCATVAPVEEITVFFTATAQTTDKTTVTPLRQFDLEQAIEDLHRCWCEGDVCELAALLDFIELTTPITMLPPQYRVYIEPDTFDNTYTFRHIEWGDGEHYITIVFMTDEPLRDFSFVTIGRWYIDQRDRFYYVSDVPFTIEELLPGEAFVLEIWFAHYNFLSAGIVFTDKNNVRQYMGLAQHMAGCCVPSPFLRSFAPTPNN